MWRMPGQPFRKGELMDNVFSDYFPRLVEKMDVSAMRSIQVFSRDGRVLAKSGIGVADIDGSVIRSVIGELDAKNPQRILYNNSGAYTVIGTPLIVGGQLMGVVLIEAINLRQSEQIALTIRISLETYIEYQNTIQENFSSLSREETIIKELLHPRTQDLEEQTVSYKLFKLLKSLGFDLFLLRAVILIELEKKTNVYFNINLDLGYEASIETFKDKVVNIIKANKFLNNQDVVAFSDNNHIVIIKSFLDVGNNEKIYYALDQICKHIMNDLDAAKIFAYRIAYGGVYSRLYDIKKSFIEAENTLRLGAMFYDHSGIYTADQGLLEHIAFYLPPIIKQKSIQTILIKLRKADGSLDLELLNVAESFVDQCMNLMKTAKSLHLHRNTVSAKMEKFKQITGLDPEATLKDAFLTKIAAVSVKIDALCQEKKA